MLHYLKETLSCPIFWNGSASTSLNTTVTPLNSSLMTLEASRATLRTGRPCLAPCSKERWMLFVRCYLHIVRV